MILSHRIVTVLFLCAALLATGLGPRDARAGESPGMLALAAPLAEQFGVPAGLVTGLLESGVSLDSVTQLLLVSKSSGQGLDNVTKVYNESGKEIDKTATKLDVAPSEYSAEKVTASIDEAKAKVQADASKTASDAASKAVGSALGGFSR